MYGGSNLILMSIHTIFFHGLIRKVFICTSLLSGALLLNQDKYPDIIFLFLNDNIRCGTH